MTLRKTAENLGISESALKNWIKTEKENEGAVPPAVLVIMPVMRQKEIARLQRELRDTKDALEVLKKQSVSWENDKSPLHSCIRVCGRNQCPARETPGFCQRDTEKSGVSRSGCHAWKKRVPLETEIYRAVLKEKSGRSIMLPIRTTELLK